MTSKREAYNMGKGAGESIGYQLLIERQFSNFYDFRDEVYETEEHTHQFSPFEFTASAFNRSRDPDGVWDAYESGIAQGAKNVWRRAGRSQAKTSRKPRKKTSKPKASFGGIPIRRVW